MGADLWTSEEAAAYLKVPPRTLDQWAYKGDGPPFAKVGRYRRYDADAVRAWVRARSTAAAPRERR